MTLISLIAKQCIIETDVKVETMYGSRIGVRIINNLIIHVGMVLAHYLLVDVLDMPQ